MIILKSRLTLLIILPARTRDTFSDWRRRPSVILHILQYLQEKKLLATAKICTYGHMSAQKPFTKKDRGIWKYFKCRKIAFYLEQNLFWKNLNVKIDAGYIWLHMQSINDLFYGTGWSYKEKCHTVVQVLLRYLHCLDAERQLSDPRQEIRLRWNMWTHIDKKETKWLRGVLFDQKVTKQTETFEELNG